MSGRAKKQAKRKAAAAASTSRSTSANNVAALAGGSAANSDDENAQQGDGDGPVFIDADDEPRPSSKSAAASAAAAAEVSDRVATGAFPPGHFSHSRDIAVVNFTLSFHGTMLIEDTEIKLSYGNRYGLLGQNGAGKSTFLKVLANREVPINEHIDIYFLEHEAEPSGENAVQFVIKDLQTKTAQLEAKADFLIETEGPDSAGLDDIYEAIEKLEPRTAARRAGEILHGLGFNKEMQARPLRDFSGGWRMRVSLAKALFVEPHLLLLDEPTNHLDLEACLWLENYLASYKSILVLVSHSQDFLNAVCTHMITLRLKRLTYWGGNYDTYVKTRAEQEENQQKQYKKEQDSIQDMKDYIARFGHGSAKLARQAQSKEKVLAKMVRGGLTEEVVKDAQLRLRFSDPGPLAPPVIQFNSVTFGYSKDRILYRNIDFGIDLDSRVALVGPNGAGKSTLLKLMNGTLTPLDGVVSRNSHLRIAWYHQHVSDLLDLDKNAVEFMLDTFKDFTGGIEGMRSYVGRFGLTGKAQAAPMRNLSGGQRARVVFGYLAYRSPHMLILDEPTNNLDMETIDSLADAINNFTGGLVLVSHDFRLISQVAREIWICENEQVNVWRGDIGSYKEHLRSKVLEDAERFAAEQ
eukprot:Amastigsp_a509135_677.p1 type:complete len:635 gc:universal Amastigsp_a509135_677:36-1940(+)